MRYIIVFDVEGEKEMNSELSKRELFETVPVKKSSCDIGCTDNN